MGIELIAYSTTLGRTHACNSRVLFVGSGTVRTFSLFVGSGTVRTFSTDYALHSPYTGSIIYPCCGEVKARVYIYDNDICTYACRMRVHAYIRMQ